MIRNILLGSALVALIACAMPGTEPKTAATATSRQTSNTEAEPHVKAGPARVRLISQEQYANTIEYIFGPDIKVPTRFPPVGRTKGLLAVGSSSVILTPSGFEQFVRNAQIVSDQVVDAAHRDFLVPCRPRTATGADADCARKFLATTGRLLYRRPLAHDELEVLVGAAGNAADQLQDFYAGIGYTLRGMLSAPEFLFIMESAQPDPRQPGEFQLDAYSLATRLSILLWDVYPDDELLTAAANGQLDTPRGRAAQVDRMMDSPRLEKGVRAFFTDMLQFDGFANLSKDPVIYPLFRPQVSGEAEEQMLRTITDHLLTRRGDYRDLFTTRRTFLSGALGALYRVPVDQAKDWSAYEFAADDPRAGLLTQVGFLALYSHAGRSSPTRRGRALRESFLCQTVPDPPPNVDFSIIEDPKAKFATARDRLSAHSTDATCAGCHKLTDPIGLALENFDGAGQFRVREKATPIDASGELDGVGFKDAVGLGHVLHNSPAVTSCVVNRLYSYGVGRETPKGDRAVLTYFEGQFATHGYRFTDLMRSIALSRAFQATSPPEGEPASGGTH
jgi:hypothetical protein